MTTSRILPLSAAALAAIAVPAVLLRAPVSHADPSPPAASSSSATAAPASASGSSSSGAYVLDSASPASSSAMAIASARMLGLLTIGDDPPGEEKSKSPSLAEWKKADKVSIEGTPVACDARRVREWIRLACRGPASSVALLVGPYEGFSAALSPWEIKPQEGSGSDDGWGGAPVMSIEGSYHLQFPVRRGERRVYEVMSVPDAFSFRMPPPSVDYYVNVSWPEGEAPLVLIQRP